MKLELLKMYIYEFMDEWEIIRIVGVDRPCPFYEYELLARKGRRFMRAPSMTHHERTSMDDPFIYSFGGGCNYAENLVPFQIENAPLYLDWDWVSPGYARVFKKEPYLS